MYNVVDPTIIAAAKTERAEFVKSFFAGLFGRKQMSTARA